MSYLRASHSICTCQAEVTELEEVVNEVQERFQTLDHQMSRAGQTATKIGDRLQVCWATCCILFCALTMLAHPKHAEANCAGAECRKYQVQS